MSGLLRACIGAGRLPFSALLLMLATSDVGATFMSPSPPGAPADAFPLPDRPIAEIVSPTRTADEERDAIDEAGQIARMMNIRPGMTVADLGAGSGYHTVRLAPRVGPEGLLIAQDVTPAYLKDLSAKVARLGLGNVKLILGEPHDPRLPKASIDAAILVHVYHEIANPFAFLHNLAPALKPGAKLGIVDYERPTWDHGTPPDLLRCELAAAGYRLVAFQKLVGDAGYLAIFDPPTAETRPPPATITPCKVKQG